MSRQHARVRDCRRLATHPGEGGRILLDGEHLLTEALRARLPIDFVLCDGRHTELADRAGAAGAVRHDCTRGVLEAASPVRTPSGILAVARWQPASLEAVLTAPDLLALGLVDVQDPGNAGAAIRSADALGASGVALLGASADPAGWKLLRGSMGSAIRLPLARGETAAALDLAGRHGVQIVATAAGGGQAPAGVDWDRPSLILLGHEGGGLPAGVAARADAAVTIAMRPGVDSLNVAVAAALVLDDARRRRQRRRPA